MLKKHKFLLAIVILAAVLRFYKLGQIPPSLDWDETAHGYNAYSILKTGRDEYGYFLPLSFRSFDDYKPPLYTYLVVPSVAVFGLNNFAVRFPSAALGVLAVLFTYLMTYELFSSEGSHFKNMTKRAQKKTYESSLKSVASGGLSEVENKRTSQKQSLTEHFLKWWTEQNPNSAKTIALLSALFLAISPWHLQFSRVAFETNSATFWSVLGTWAFLRGIEAKSKTAAWMSLAAIAFGANLFMYHNARVFIPTFSLMLIFLFREKLLRLKKYLIIPSVISLIFIAVLIPILFSISGQLRFKGTTIFADVSPQYKASELIAQDEESGQLLIGKILHNRRLIYSPILIDNYLSHLKPTYLFFTADMDRHHAPQIGLLYLWDLPFILAGIYFLIRKNFNLKSKIIIFWWFLIAPIAASVTWGVPHSLRSEIYLPTYQIFAAIGVLGFFRSLKKNNLPTFSLPAITLMTAGLLIFNFLFYLYQYYVHMPVEFSQAWLYGRKEAVLFSDSIKLNYDRVIVSTKLEQPHEFWLYYLKYDPKKYLQEGGTASGGYLEDRNKFDKYLFKPIDYEKQRAETKTLFVGLPKDFPAGANVIKKFYYLDGEPAIYIVGE